MNLNNSGRVFLKPRLLPVEFDGGTDRPLAASVDRWAVISTCFVVLWSLVELLWEMDAGRSVEQSSAILTSKLLLLALVVLSLKELTLARGAFAFLCLVSVIVIAVAMSAEYANALNLAFLSAIELAGKLSACIAIVFQLGLKARPPSTHGSL